MKRAALAILLIFTIIGSSSAALAHRAGAQTLLTFYFWGDSTEYHENVVATRATAQANGVVIRNVQEQGNYETGLLTRIAAGNGPDFFYIPDWWLPQLAAKGALLNLDPYIAKYPQLFKKSNFQPQAIEGLTYKGHLYGLPRGMSGTVLYYNKDMFDQMHVAYPSASWTMTDLLNAAKRLTTKDHWGLVLHNQNSSDKPNLFWGLWQFGTDYLNASKTQCTLTDPKAQAALTWLRDLSYKEHVSPTPTEFSANGWAGSMFGKGKAAMILGAARWFYDYGPLIGKNAPTFHWSAQLPPLAADGKRYTYPGYAGMAIWSGTRKPDLAFKVGSGISQSAGQSAIATAGIDMPVFLPALRSKAVFVAPDKQADTVSLQALNFMRIPRYVVNMKEVQAALDHDLANFWQNQDTVQHATQATCADINPLLK